MVTKRMAQNNFRHYRFHFLISNQLFIFTAYFKESSYSFWRNMI